MGITTSPPKDFDFYDHVRSNFSCCSIYESNPKKCKKKVNKKKGEVVKLFIERRKKALKYLV